jgi:hypothetical protein
MFTMNKKKASTVQTVAVIAALAVMLAVNAVEGANHNVAAVPVAASSPIVRSVSVKAGPKGAPGTPGAVGTAGVAGKNGTGVAGAKGKDGTNGTNGAAGVSVTSVTCNPDGTWKVTYSDLHTDTVTGPCIAQNGADGAPGAQGSAPVGWTYVDGYGFRFQCVEASYFTVASPQYTCKQG